MTLKEFLAEYRRMSMAGYYCDVSPREMEKLLQIIDLQDKTLQSLEAHYKHPNHDHNWAYWANEQVTLTRAQVAELLAQSAGDKE